MSLLCVTCSRARGGSWPAWQCLRLGTGETGNCGSHILFAAVRGFPVPCASKHCWQWWGCRGAICSTAELFLEYAGASADGTVGQVGLAPTGRTWLVRKFFIHLPCLLSLLGAWLCQVLNAAIRSPCDLKPGKLSNSMNVVHLLSCTKYYNTVGMCSALELATCLWLFLILHLEHKCRHLMAIGQLVFNLLLWVQDIALPRRIGLACCISIAGYNTYRVPLGDRVQSYVS